MALRPSLVAAVALLAVPLRAQPPEPEAFEASAGRAAELPGGQEADGLPGDWVLRNDRIAVTVSACRPGRHVHLTVGHSSGVILDATPRDRAADRFTSLHAGVQEWVMTEAQAGVERERPAGGPERVCAAWVAARNDPAKANGLSVEHRYRLEAGACRVRIATTLRNQGAAPLKGIEAADRVRADGMMAAVRGERPYAYWVHYEEPAVYGLAAAQGGVRIELQDPPWWGTVVHYPGAATRVPGELQPGETLTWERDFFTVRDAAEMLEEVSRHDGLDLARVEGQVVEPRAGGAGEGPAAAMLAVTRFGRPVEEALRVPVDGTGRFAFALPPGRWQFTASTVGRAALLPVALDLAGGSGREPAYVRLRLPPPARIAVAAAEAGRPVPCKVRFAGLSGTPTPDLGPSIRAHGAGDLFYAETGSVTQEVAPGAYRVVVSRGPEYDVVEREVRVAAGETAKVEAALVRSVDTTGWIAADLHSHTTESGDNVVAVADRLINHAAEGVEFVPATDHNRIVDWTPAIERLGLGAHLKSVPGIELTGRDFHYNAFPLQSVPGVQDRGAPPYTSDPVEAARRLRALGDGGLRYVQLNHPGLDRAFNDRDGDGKPDGGWPGAETAFDGIEVYESSVLEMRQVIERTDPPIRVPNRALHWLQYLNRGHRYAAAANTDAHDTLYGSGYPRNYIRSSTDDPARIDPAEMVRALKAMQVVMTNAPFLEASVDGHGPGEAAIAAAGRPVTLKVRVQCAKGYDVDRVQVLLNGRADPAVNFTRAGGAAGFRAEGAVRFEAEIPLKFDRDTHVIVVATGEGSSLETLGGGKHRGERPTAISNPVFVDVGGDGFTPDGDTLGFPLPAAMPR